MFTQNKLYAKKIINLMQSLTQISGASPSNKKISELEKTVEELQKQNEILLTGTKTTSSSKLRGSPLKSKRDRNEPTSDFLDHIDSVNFLKDTGVNRGSLTNNTLILELDDCFCRGNYAKGTEILKKVDYKRPNDFTLEKMNNYLSIANRVKDLQFSEIVKKLNEMTLEYFDVHGLLAEGNILNKNSEHTSVYEKILLILEGINPQQIQKHSACEEERNSLMHRLAQLSEENKTLNASLLEQKKAYLALDERKAEIQNDLSNTRLRNESLVVT